MRPPPGFHRVTKRDRCLVCDRPDYCLNPDRIDDEPWCFCWRCYSPIETKAGYKHFLGDPARIDEYKRRPIARPVAAPSTFNAARVAEKYRAAIDKGLVEALAASLRLSAEYLNAIGLGWTGRAYSFPMCDGDGEVIGIRIRDAVTGAKWCERGSRNGLFIPSAEPTSPLIIVEGATDPGAIFDAGYFAIGRPNACACPDMTVRYARRLGYREAVIVPNFDPPKHRPDGTVFHPGQDGARVQAAMLVDAGVAVKVIYPLRGNKDVRQWQPTRDELDCAIANAGWWRAKPAQLQESHT